MRSGPAIQVWLLVHKTLVAHGLAAAAGPAPAGSGCCRGGLCSALDFLGDPSGKSRLPIQIAADMTHCSHEPASGQRDLSTP